MSNSFLFRYRWQLIALAFSIFLFLLGYGIAKTNISIQMKAFQTQIKTEEVNDRGVSHSRLIIKYIKQKELYSEKINRDKLDNVEFQYNQEVLQLDKKNNSAKRLTWNEQIVLSMINTYRLLTGYKMITIEQKRDTFHEIIVAYNLEKNQEYQAAIDIYEKNLLNQHDLTTRGNIYLHIGFCHAMLENDAEARAYYKDVIAQYPGTDLSIAASILLKYMEMFDQERNRVLQSTSTSLIKGEKLSILLSHKSALQVIESFQSTDQDEIARLNFTKGICYEALGEKQKAIDAYVTSIKTGLNTKSARYANRRIYTIASYLPNNNDIIMSSMKIAEKQKDKILIELDYKYRDEITSSLKLGDEGHITSEQIMQAVESSEILSKEDKASPAIIVPVMKPLKIEIVNEIVTSMQGKEVRVVTISNEIFTGKLMNSEKEAYILIDTLIGQFGIRKDKIKAMDILAE